MTAAGLDYVSGGRFNLGLGASGPQVVEGFHGVKYDAPLGRTREVIEICRQVWRREPVEFAGRHYRIPLTKEARRLRAWEAAEDHQPPGPCRASRSRSRRSGPKNVALVAELAEGWQPLFFHPGKAAAGVG